MPPLACAPHIARAGDTKISGHIFTNTAMECNARTTTPPGPRGNKTPFLILTKAGGEPIGLGLPVNCSPVSTPGLCSCWTWNLEFLKETARKVMTRAPPDGETPQIFYGGAIAARLCSRSMMKCATGGGSRSRRRVTTGVESGGQGSAAKPARAAGGHVRAGVKKAGRESDGGREGGRQLQMRRSKQQLRRAALRRPEPARATPVRARILPGESVLAGGSPVSCLSLVPTGATQPNQTVPLPALLTTIVYLPCCSTRIEITAR